MGEVMWNRRVRASSGWREMGGGGRTRERNTERQ